MQKVGVALKFEFQVAWILQFLSLFIDDDCKQFCSTQQNCRKIPQEQRSDPASGGQWRSEPIHDVDQVPG